MPNGSPRCKNGGSCVIHENATVTCMCSSDYEGPFCGKSNFYMLQIKIDNIGQYVFVFIHI